MKQLKKKINNLLNTETKFIIGHLRYATSGNNINNDINNDINNEEYIQPFVNNTNKLSIIHNGNIPDKEINKIINKINLKYPNFYKDNTNIPNKTRKIQISTIQKFFDYLDYHQTIKTKYHLIII